MTDTGGIAGGLRSALRRGGPPPFRTLAILAGVVLIGASISVYYHVADVTGARLQLGFVVLGALLLGTLMARLDRDFVGLATGGVMLLLGISGYLLAVPSLRQELLRIDFYLKQFTYLTGVSVLQFREADAWAIGTAPGLVFLSWYLLLRRRYDAGALVGGLTLAYFILTGDAGGTITLLGMIGLFGVLAFGSLERHGGTWAQVERIGISLAIAVVVARALQIVPSSQARTVRTGGGRGAATLETSLLNANDRVRASGSISLSPSVRFTVESEKPDYWHVAAYDRYTGDGWIRTGEDRQYDGRLRSPPGPAQEMVQQFTAETTVSTMPAAWKPIRVGRRAAAVTSVSSLGGLKPTSTWSEGESYTVVSQVTDRKAESLREAGTDYPEGVRDRHLGLPDSLPERVSELARTIAGDAETPYAAALKIERWLESNKGYSLRIVRPEGDIVDAFLFEMDTGYCVYFASAMVVLLRTLGIPARFAVGYSTGERVGRNRWVVRGLNSHAWVEVHFPGVGWVPFDPTPASGRGTVRDSRIERARSQGLSSVDTDETRPTVSTPAPTITPPRDTGLEDSTNGSVSGESPIGPGGAAEDRRERRQEELLRETPEGIGAGTLSTPESPTDGQGDAGGGGRVFDNRDRLTALAGALGLTIGAHRLGLIERAYDEVWLRRQPESDDPLRDVERAYARLERLLATRHRERRPDETPREYLEALDAAVDERARRVATIYERARYADEVSRETATEAIELVDRLVGSR